MIRPDYRDFRKDSKFVVETGIHLEHSAKGSTWEDHKYIKRIDGTYYYPDGYEGGRHLPEGDKERSSGEKIELTKNDVENLAKEVIRGQYGDGQIRKDLLGENYSEVQKRVNELLKGSVGQKKVSEATTESVKKAEETAKKADNSNIHSGVDMEKVQSVYRNKKK